MPPKIVLIQFEKLKSFYSDLRNVHNCTATTIVEKKVENLIKELEEKFKTYNLREEERFLVG